MTAESGKTHIALATGTEADTWRTDNIRTVEQSLEERPGAHAIGRAHPDIRRILTTIDLIAQFTQLGEHAVGIVHIVVDGLLDLLFALGSIDGLSSTLRDITRAIELRTLTAQPQLVQRDALPFEVQWHELYLAACC